MQSEGPRCKRANRVLPCGQPQVGTFDPLGGVPIALALEIHFLGRVGGAVRQSNLRRPAPLSSPASKACAKAAHGHDTLILVLAPRSIVHGEFAAPAPVVSSRFDVFSEPAVLSAHERRLGPPPTPLTLRKPSIDAPLSRVLTSGTLAAT